MIEVHIEYGTRILDKPILFIEFGKPFQHHLEEKIFYAVYKHTYAYASRGGKGDPNNVFAIDKRRNHHREIWHVKFVRNMLRLIEKKSI